MNDRDSQLGMLQLFLPYDGISGYFCGIWSVHAKNLVLLTLQLIFSIACTPVKKKGKRPRPHSFHGISVHGINIEGVRDGMYLMHILR